MPISGVDPNLPVSLGKVAPTLAPLPVTENLSTLLKNPGIRVKSLFIQSLPDNSGEIYIGTASMNITTMEGVFAILSSGDATHAFVNTMMLNDLDPNKIYVMSENSGEGIIGYVKFA